MQLWYPELKNKPVVYYIITPKGTYIGYSLDVTRRLYNYNSVGCRAKNKTIFNSYLDTCGILFKNLEVKIEIYETKKEAMDKIKKELANHPDMYPFNLKGKKEYKHNNNAYKAAETRLKNGKYLVEVKDKNGTIIATCDLTTATLLTGAMKTNIYKCIIGTLKTTNGYRFNKLMA